MKEKSTLDGTFFGDKSLCYNYSRKTLAIAFSRTGDVQNELNNCLGDAADFLMLLGAGNRNLKAGSLSLNPIHRRRRSLSQSQLLDLGVKSHHHHHLHHLSSHHQGLFGKVPASIGLFDNPVASNQVTILDQGPIL